MSPTRLLPVPEGLVGVRLDVAVARLFGLSRTAAAALIDSGDVLVDGGLPPRSARLADSLRLLERRLPDAERDPMPPQIVDGLAVLYDDADLVVVDKPAGVAAHPSPGWTGPTVVSGLSAMGYQVATSGAAERQGIVHRLDVGTTGVMAVAKSERAYSVLKRAFKTRAVEKRYAALAQGHPDPTSGTIDAPIGRHPSRTTSSRSSPAVARALPTTRPRRHFGRRHCSTSILKPEGRTRSGFIWRPSGIRVWETLPTARIRCWRLGSACPGRACTLASWASPTRHRGSGWLSVRPTHRTCCMRSICCDGTGSSAGS